MLNFQAMISRANEHVARTQPKVQVDELIVDANNLLYRLGHKDGGNVDLMIVSTFEKLLNLREWYGAKTVHMVWEGTGENWRLDILPSYKSARSDSKLRQAVREAETRLTELLSLTNFEQWQPINAEGDDGFAALATRILKQTDHTVGIYSSDRDLLQLARPRVVLIVPQRGEPDNVETHESVSITLGGLRPDQIPDVKGLMGDPGDGIIGVPGLGKKYALELISKHGSLENVIAFASDPARERMDGETATSWLGRVRSELGCTLRKMCLIVEHAESARASKIVGGIRDDIMLDPGSCSMSDPSELAKLLAYKFRNFEYVSEYVMDRIDSMVTPTS